jgi:ParB family transcriptional regulator, chromosome partitioning protein
LVLVNPTFGLLERIEVRRICLSRRPLRDSLGNIYELAKSIEEKGLLQPIIVKPSDNGFFEVIVGNRRLAACKRVKLKTILCYIADFDDKEALEVSLIENVHHESLNYIEEAKAFKRYVEEREYGAISELARKIGKSPTYVSRRIDLLNLPEHIQEELLRHRKSSSVAQELISLDEERRNEISKLILETNMTSSEVRSIVKNIKKEEDESLFSKEEDESLFSIYYSLDDKRQRVIERVLTKCIASFKVCMMRFDDAIGYLDQDEWLLWDALMQYRSFTHQQIDSLLKLQKKIIRKSPRRFN